MDLKVKTYPEELTEFDFYGYIGKYFAEPTYKKQLPYMNHNENRHWRLYFNQSNELVGFSSYEIRKQCVYLTSTLIVEDYRGKGLGKQITNEVIDLFPNDVLKCVTNNEKGLKILKEKGFSCVNQRGSYEYLIKEGGQND